MNATKARSRPRPRPRPLPTEISGGRSSSPPPPVAIFIHRRDLRVEDNLALDLVRREAPEGVRVVRVFILHPDQVDPRRNPYHSERAVSFMRECVDGCDARVLRARTAEAALDAWDSHADGEVRLVAFNEDVTPWARTRDARLTAWCGARGIPVLTAQDYTLFPRGAVRPGSGSGSGSASHHYEVFAPFWRRCVARAASEIPRPLPSKRPTRPTRPHPRRAEALAILRRVRAGAFEDYASTRDFPALDATTHLSAYLKFGCVSVREAFWAAADAHGLEHPLVREMLWREFCAQLVAAAPRVLRGQIDPELGNAPLRPKYASTRWPRGEAHPWVARWREGRTGFPLVDASMRCLNATGFLPNRCRMVVAAFLTKDVRADWRIGERYFATQLVDYDPASNSFGWQWAAGVGADALPVFRAFNPWAQGARFDADAAFVLRWVPELATGAVPRALVHRDSPAAAAARAEAGYGAPMLDHARETAEAKAALMMRKA